ncbi:MAG: type II toxin-antitoxin system VapC family toxin [Myxococcales bacterium]|jgi:predicted nucleic acid-binding protein
MIVADASVVIDLLIGGAAAAPIADRLFGAGESIHVPHLLDVEVVQGLRRHAMSGALFAERALHALADLADLPLQRHPHHDLIPRVWELRSSLTAYDAVYVALAEILDAPLVTRDGKLLRAHGHRARVDLI